VDSYNECQSNPCKNNGVCRVSFLKLLLLKLYSFSYSHP
jgi:hypothetical protein